MKKIDRPRLFIVDEIKVILNNAIDELSQIKMDVEYLDKDYLIKSMYIYIFSIYESTLSNCLTKYLVAFPEKIDIAKVDIKEDFKILSKQSIPTDFFKSIADTYISNLLYKNSEEFLRILENILSIETDYKTVAFNLKEKKATRNILVHNNLRVNRKYLDTAGSKLRSEKVGTYLNLDFDYIIETLDILIEHLKIINKEISIKYSSFTMLNLLKKLWLYLFDSPLLIFDEYWICDEKNILGFNTEHASKLVNNLSSYEQTLLSVWLQQFSSSIQKSLFSEISLQFWLPIADEVALINQINDMYPYIFYGKEKGIFGYSK